MVSSPTLRIRQKLFDAISPGGRKFVFAILDDDRCAITCDDEIVEVRGGDVQSVDRAVGHFLEVIRTSDEPCPTN